MPQYYIKRPVEEIVDAVKNADSLDTIEHWLVLMFKSLSIDDLDRRIKFSNRSKLLFEKSKDVKPGTFDALSFSLILETLTSESVLDAGIDPRSISEHVVNLKSGSDENTVINHYKSKGEELLSKLKDDLHIELKKLSQRVMETRNRLTEETRNVQLPQELLDKIKNISTKEIEADIYKKLEELKNKGLPRKQFIKEKEKLQKEYHEKQAALYSGVRSEQETFINNSVREAKEDFENAIEEIKKIKEEIFANTLKVLVENSNVSDEDAEAWYTNNVVIEDNAFARLKRSSDSAYNSKDQLKADIKEFYKLTGGGLARINIVTTGARRASASWSGFNINIDSDFSKVTLFHEMGHHVEYLNKSALSAATSFRDLRAKSSKTVKLKNISSLGYGDSERALEDDFFHPYVGKVYKNQNNTDRATEVISMGMQQLASVEHVADLLMFDREHLALILGVCTAKDDATRIIIDSLKNDESNVDKRKLREYFDSELKRVATKAALAEYLPGKRGADEWPMLVPDRSGKGGYVYFSEK